MKILKLINPITNNIDLELLEDRDDYDSKVDIWALGWTFYELLFGVDPWPVSNVRSKVTLSSKLMILG